MMLDRGTLHAALADPALESMNFLNEVAIRYPDAISFAAGRPYEDLFDAADVPRYLAAYTAHLAAKGYDRAGVNRLLFQYGRTKGIIHDLVAHNLAVDENMEVDPESVVVTVGAQEGMYLVLRALRRTERDALLAVSPNYVGITGAAQLVDMPVLPVASGDEGVDLDDLVEALHRAAVAGLWPRALYLVPDFANPTGATIGLETRRRLLDIAAGHNLLLLEDNPYGLFHARGERLPTLKALDRTHQVVYLGSFAKTALPGARVGYVVADQPVSGGGLFADELSKIKSMVTVNTAPLAQAVVGGKLVENGYSLDRANAREAQVYRRNRRLVLDGLAARFPEGTGVTWNTPGGGFFLVLTVPFRVDDALLEESAREFGVLWTPMYHFFGGKGGEHQIRLSYSLLTPERVDTGLDRLAALVAAHT